MAVWLFMSIKNDENLEIHMVSHVHWDRMWYSSFEEYRMRLYKLMKKLLCLLEENQNYESFMFDGQVEAIDDYLELAPEDESRVKKLIADGRLIVGPWYVQPEEFLISGETHIRNLKMGMERAKELGGCMKVSYLCDPVGHLAQMPQIVKGFDIDYFVATRGMLDNRNILNCEFLWEAPDGSRVLVHSVPYYNKFSGGQVGFINHMDSLIKKYAPLHKSKYVLYLNGADHEEPNRDIVEFVREYNRTVGCDSIVPTTLEQHMKQLEVFSEELLIHRGEMRNAYTQPILSGILSTRMEIKRKNAEIETGLEKYLEPYSTWSWLVGNEYPEAFCKLAWTYQIRNSFHDCIYGAHADHITPDIMSDYKRAEELIRWNTNEALHYIGSSVGVLAANVANDTQINENCYKIVCFNPTSWARTNVVVDTDIYFDSPKKEQHFVIEDCYGNVLPYQVNHIEKVIKLTNDTQNMYGDIFDRELYKMSLSILVKSIPGNGYTTLFVKEGMQSSRDYFVHAAEKSCENEYLKLDFNHDGTINVFDKTTGENYESLHYFVDSGDRGDQYNYSPTCPQGIFTSKKEQAKIELECIGPVKAVYKVILDLQLPEGLNKVNQGRSDKFTNNRIISYITLRASSRVLEFHTDIDNCSKDHRLTVVFPTQIKTDFIYAGSQFCILKRERELKPSIDWIEQPSEFRPHHRFVQIHDNSRSFSFMDKGLPEHKVTKDGDLYITLLRCTGFLSKDSLPERSYSHAGPAMSTPLAQELGQHSNDYAIRFGKEDWIKEQTYRYSQEFEAPVTSIFISGLALDKALPNVHQQASIPTLPSEMSFLNLDGEGIVVSAIKKGVHDNLILRFYNLNDHPQDTSLKLFRPIKKVSLVNLAENWLADIPHNGNLIELTMRGNQIVTLSLEFIEGGVMY